MEAANEQTKNQMIVEHVIFVRDSGQTHIATARGMKASCTAGREQAARRLAEKLMGGKAYTFTKCFKNNDRSYLVIA